MRNMLSKALTVTGLAAVVLLGAFEGTASAVTLADFTVDISDATGNLFTGDTERDPDTDNPTLLNPIFNKDQFVADEITGTYNEVLSVTSFDGTNGTFVTLAYVEVSSFSRLDGSDELNSLITIVQDNLYALFVAEGTFTVDGDDFVFTGTSGAFNIYLDYNSDTTFDLPDNATNDLSDITLGNSAEDKLLAYSNTLTSGDGEIQSNPDELDNGSFALVFNPFNLTSPTGVGVDEGPGSLFFIEPVPFYIQIIMDGQFRFDFDPENPAGQELSGSIDANFEIPSAVPEPATLALFGLGLVGVAVAARRRGKNA